MLIYNYFSDKCYNGSRVNTIFAWQLILVMDIMEREGYAGLGKEGKDVCDDLHDACIMFTSILTRATHGLLS